MSGSKKQTSSQTSTFALSPELQAKYDAIWNKAEPLANSGYTPYQGSLVAGLTGNQTNAMNATGANLSEALQTNPFDIMKNLEGFDAGTIAGTDLSKYMNPYENDVVNNTIADLNKAREITMLKNGDSAISQGAFGGDRRGVTDALTNADFAKQVGDTVGQLRMQGYNTALTSAQNDITNRQNDFAAKLGLAGQEASTMQQLISDLFGYGAVEQATNQAGLDADYQKFLEERDWDKSQTAWLAQILGMQPTTGTQTGTTTSKESGGSLFGNILGAGLGIAGLFTGGATTPLAGLFSGGGSKLNNDIYTHIGKGQALGYF